MERCRRSAACSWATRLSSASSAARTCRTRSWSCTIASRPRWSGSDRRRCVQTCLLSRYVRAVNNTESMLNLHSFKPTGGCIFVPVAWRKSNHIHQICFELYHCTNRIRLYVNKGITRELRVGNAAKGTSWQRCHVLPRSLSAESTGRNDPACTPVCVSPVNQDFRSTFTLLALRPVIVLSTYRNLKETVIADRHCV